MEQLDLTNPVTTPPVTTANYRVQVLLLDWETIQSAEGKGLVRITVRDNNGVVSDYQYTGPEALDLMKWMNTANFTVNSMHKRILQKLSNDGFLPGTVTGTPDPPTKEF